MYFTAPASHKLEGYGKISLTTTLITGSTAAGEAIPPHFQFSTKAQIAEMEKLRVELVAYMPHVRGKFGAPEDQEWTITVGMNSRGGMDNVEFDEYLSNSLIPLYPGAEEVKGNRVLFKLASGPVRLGIKLLARLCLFGFVLYPGVPNTTALSQETDRNYGPFKTAFRIILDEIFQERMFKKRKTALNPWLFGIVVFGEVDPETGVLVRKNAFQEGF